MNDIENSPSKQESAASTPEGQKAENKTIAFIVYALQVLALINGITAIVGVVMNYVKLDEVKGTWLESHFRWQIRTFWFGLLWAVIGAITVVFFIGILILIANLIWIIYRIVKGWLCLNDMKPVS